MTCNRNIFPTKTVLQVLSEADTIIHISSQSVYSVVVFSPCSEKVCIYIYFNYATTAVRISHRNQLAWILFLGEVLYKSDTRLRSDSWLDLII